MANRRFSICLAAHKLQLRCKILTYGADFDSGMLTGELSSANLPLGSQYR